jgi:peroxiredoxin Q/BCP
LPLPAQAFLFTIAGSFTAAAPGAILMPSTTIPDFELPATGGQRFRLSAFAGHSFIIYFYPKDNTPGCTDEGVQFRDLYQSFLDAGYQIIGVSRDSVKSHENFKKKMNFPFDLLSDEEEIACAIFGVMKMKNMYGKQVRGVERSTFVIGADGAILKEWRGIKVPGHAQAVLDYVKANS